MIKDDNSSPLLNSLKFIYITLSNSTSEYESTWNSTYFLWIQYIIIDRRRKYILLVTWCLLSSESPCWFFAQSSYKPIWPPFYHLFNAHQFNKVIISSSRNPQQFIHSTMKATIITFAFFIAVATAAKPVVAAAKPAVAVSVPASICYKKVTSCCWKYGTCGVKVAKQRVNAKCPEARPAKKCIKVCKPVVVKSTKTKCWNTLRYGPKKCLDHPWLPKVCVGIPFIKKTCKNVQVSTATMPCKHVCTTVKHIYIQPCYYFKIMHHAKFCAKLSCGKAEVKGTSTKPGVVVAKTGKFVSKSKVTNYGKAIKHKW